MKTILVTGANKGIGLATVEAILREQSEFAVLLGSRNLERGQQAVEDLLAKNSFWNQRLRAIELDVSDQRSIDAAMRNLQQTIGSNESLYALVNNAGMGSGELSDVLNVNLYGIKRCCEAFIPFLTTGGRIANVTSASGPNFVANCDQERQDFFCDPETDWTALHQLVTQCQQIHPGDWYSLGMHSQSFYGLSKACANSLNRYLADKYPNILINACTPGFIETDLGKEFLGHRSPQEAGMKTPADGARVIMSLLFGEARGSGYYYGSDGLRSPLDRYRAPGSPEFSS